MPISKKEYAFKKGQVLHMNEIYLISGLGDDWWEADDPSEKTRNEEMVTITRDIEIMYASRAAVMGRQ